MSSIRRYKINSGAIDASGNAIAYSAPITGRILAVMIDYPAHACTVDLDTDGPISQKILDLSSASTDRVVYPRVQVHDYQGNGVTYDGTNEIYEPFVVAGRVKLTVAGGTANESVSVYLVVEEH